MKVRFLISVALVAASVSSRAGSKDVSEIIASVPAIVSEMDISVYSTATSYPSAWGSVIDTYASGEGTNVSWNAPEDGFDPDVQTAMVDDINRFRETAMRTRIEADVYRGISSGALDSVATVEKTYRRVRWASAIGGGVLLTLLAVTAALKLRK